MMQPVVVNEIMLHLYYYYCVKTNKKSAGILLYRFKNGELKFFLVHPGGPFWAKKDAGVWSLPKGEFTDEDPLDAAKRELAEETGIVLPTGDEKLIPLTPVTIKSGKTIYAWAVEGDADETAIKSNTFEMEWPPKSGKTVLMPEVDKAGWFNKTDALVKINESQGAFIAEATQLINTR
jgi:predicted NUDIX family NTP pyrophosphohydrolase